MKTSALIEELWRMQVQVAECREKEAARRYDGQGSVGFIESTTRYIRLRRCYMAEEARAIDFYVTKSVGNNAQRRSS